MGSCRKLRFTPFVSDIYRTVLDTGFDAHSQQRIPLLARISGDVVPRRVGDQYSQQPLFWPGVSCNVKPGLR
ncbi:hypothetical protein WKH32_07180 [Pantoea agglomerans]|uniref:hypothetical protein n=1 Tax=Enterobacter agglomerans TaxID=549 RepID=UPI003C7A4B64